MWSTGLPASASTAARPSSPPTTTAWACCARSLTRHTDFSIMHACMQFPAPSSGLQNLDFQALVCACVLTLNPAACMRQVRRGPGPPEVRQGARGHIM